MYGLMNQKQSIQLFQDSKVRTVWNEEQEKWYFSVVDVVGILVDSVDYQTARNYWKVLKHRLLKEGNEMVTSCNRLKLLAPDGKMRMTDVADAQQIFRIIQSIPSRKAEPFKQWMAQVAAQRLDQMQDPELSIEQAMMDYHRLGYSEKWINQRIKSIEVRKELTDEWKRAGVKEGMDFATLTNILTKEWSGKTVGEYKNYKGLHKENLRDNMTNLELALNMLAEASTAEIHRTTNPDGFQASKQIAKQGGGVAKVARQQLEKELGHSVVSSLNARDTLIAIEVKTYATEETNPKEDR